MKKDNLKEKNTILIDVPGSKSITHRAIIAGALAEGKSKLSGFLLCSDTRYTLEGMNLLGARSKTEGDNLIIYGRGMRPYEFKGIKHLYLGDSGTSIRILLSISALSRGIFILTGSQRMKQRPVGGLVSALLGLGVDLRCMERDGFPPIYLDAKGIRGGRVTVSGTHSSQYISSILISAPYAQKDIEIELKDEPVSKPYIDLTIDVMERFGVRVMRDRYRFFKVSSGNPYRPYDFRIEGDVSSASYFWGASAITGIKIITKNIFPFDTRQGDIRFLDLLEHMGCAVTRKKDMVIVEGRNLNGTEVDMMDIPDMVPTLSAVALFARGKTVIRNVRHLKYKESDRLRVLSKGIRALGGKVDLTEDGMIIYGGKRLHPATIDPENDHRIAMAFAIAGLRIPGIRILNRQCVIKSFPDFWNLWKMLENVISYPGMAFI